MEGWEDKKVKDEPKTASKAKKRASYSVDAKIEEIMQSKLSQSQKDEYVSKLKSPDSGNEISFGIYANMRNVKPAVRQAMQAHPMGKSVKSATVERWDEIYRDFY